MGMVEKDTIRALDEAIVRLNALDGARDDALADAQKAVRAARELGMSVMAISKRTGKHRNTITEWCKDDDGQS